MHGQTSAATEAEELRKTLEVCTQEEKGVRHHSRPRKQSFFSLESVVDCLNKLNSD